MQGSNKNDKLTDVRINSLRDPSILLEAGINFYRNHQFMRSPFKAIKHGSRLG